MDKRLIRVIVLLCVLFCIDARAIAQDQAIADPLVAKQLVLVEAAKRHIDAWRASGGGDVRGERPLIITLFTGSDTEPAPRYRERLTRTMQHIQAFYAKEMDRNGFGPDHGADGVEPAHVLHPERRCAAHQDPEPRRPGPLPQHLGT